MSECEQHSLCEAYCCNNLLIQKDKEIESLKEQRDELSKKVGELEKAIIQAVKEVEL